MPVSRSNTKKPVRKKPISKTKAKPEPQKPLEVVVVPKTPGTFLDKAVDIIKVKGQNIVSGRQDKVAAEGLIKGLKLSKKVLLNMYVSLSS
jgi:hypothetical protein